MDTHCFGRAVQLSRDLLGYLAGPTLQRHLGMNLPIGWGMIAPGQFADLALFLFILCCSGLYALGHGFAPSLVISPLLWYHH
jgi:hypothetical protein